MPVGGQPGNQNAAKGKRWEAALERAFAAWPNPPDCTDCNDLMRGLNMAAHVFVRNTMAGEEFRYFQETGDRFDGKVTQPVEQKTELSGSLELSQRPQVSPEEWLKAHGVGATEGTAG